MRGHPGAERCRTPILRPDAVHADMWRIEVDGPVERPGQPPARARRLRARYSSDATRLRSHEVAQLQAAQLSVQQRDGVVVIQPDDDVVTNLLARRQDR
jgi:hypothetical protein